MSTHAYYPPNEPPGPTSSNILDDFQAPTEATKPYQDQLLRIKQAFAALDGRWIQFNKILESGIEFTDEEKTVLAEFLEAKKQLHAVIINKQDSGRPDEPPARNIDARTF